MIPANEQRTGEGKHLGLVLLFDHYPAVCTDPQKLDRQFRDALGVAGHVIDKISVVDFSAGVPASLPECDVWVVSGSPELLLSSEAYARGMNVVRRLAATSPVLGVNHGEHFLHDALCSDATPPATPRAPKSVRNPFWSFWSRDRLFDVSEGLIRALPRPERSVCLF